MLWVVFDVWWRESDAVLEVVISSEAGSARVLQQRLREMAWFVLLVLGLIVLLERMTPIPTIVVVPLVVLLVSSATLLLLEGHIELGKVISEHARVRMPSGSGEAGFMLAAGFFGVILATSGLSEYGIEWLLGISATLGISFAVIIPLLVLAVSLPGIPPLIAVALVVSAVPVAMTGLPPVQYASVLVVGSGTAVLIAPLTPTMLMISGYSGLAPLRIGVRNNAIFATCYLSLLIYVGSLLT